MKSLLILFILFFASTSQPSTKCQNFFEKLVTKIMDQANLSSYSPEEYLVLLYSGKNINDVGYYTLCQDTPSQRYVLVMSNTSLLQDDFVFGICGPTSCISNDYYEIIDSINDFIKLTVETYVNRTFPKLEGVRFIDPNEIEISDGFSYHLTVYIIVTLGFLIIFSTAYKSFRGEEHINREDPNNLPSYYHSIDVGVSRDQPGFGSLYEESWVKRLLDCFSIGTNIDCLWKTKLDPWHDEDLGLFNGVRAIALFLIILLQTVNYESFVYKNYVAGDTIMHEPSYLVILLGLKAIDVFFFMSGLFVGFMLLSKLNQMELTVKHYCEILFHRWVRLWPLYFVLMLVYWKISVYWAHGPFWVFYVDEAESCNDTWFNNVLMLNNWLIQEGEGYCMEWSWFIATDFQLFVFTPLIVWLYLKNAKRMTVLITNLIIGGLIIGFIFNDGLDNYFTLDPAMDFETLKWSFRNPLVRAPVYLLGLAVGICYRNYKNREGGNYFQAIQGHDKVRMFSQIFGAILVFWITWLPRELQHGEQWSEAFALAYQSFSGFLFVLGLLLFLSPALVGQGSISKAVLSCGMFRLIARISFAAYLLSGIITMMHAYRQTSAIGLEIGRIYQDTMASFIIAWVFGCIAYITLERPFNRLETNFVKYNYEPKRISLGDTGFGLQLSNMSTL